MIAHEMNYIQFDIFDHPLGFFLVITMVFLAYYVPFSFVRRFSPTIVMIRGVIHSIANLGFLVLGVGFLVNFIGAGSPPQAIVEAIGMCVLAAITTFFDIRFYRNFYAFNQRVRTRSVQAGVPANPAKVE